VPNASPGGRRRPTAERVLRPSRSDQKRVNPAADRQRFLNAN
jgi:hypothetical protein